MHANKDVLSIADVSKYQTDVLVRVDVVPVTDDAPVAMLSGEPRLGDAVDETLGLEAMRDELRHGDEGDTVIAREVLQLRATRRRTVVVEDLANHTGRREPSEPSEIDRGLGMSNTLEHSPLSRPQREDVAAAS